MDRPPLINPEELAGYKTEISADVLLRWAEAIVGAHGSLRGVNEGFAQRGWPVVDLITEECAHLDEIRREIVQAMVDARSRRK